MSTVPTITINLEARCDECGNAGCADSGLCLKCTTKAIRRETMRSMAGRAVQRRYFEFVGRRR
jgi:hypothetical protein